MQNTPILVGVAQNEQRISDPAEHKEPLELMFEALSAAAVDSGNPHIIDAATSIRVIRGKWPYANPAGLLAEQLGLAKAETCGTQYGGNYVQTVLNQSALDIQAGRHEVILITGAECGNTQAKAKRAGLKLRWEARDGTPDRVFGEDLPMAHDEEIACKIYAPIQMYPMFENALRDHLGETQQQHIDRVATLWAGFSEVAANNPHAWLRQAKSAQEIRTLSATNRAVSLPYPKLMNSNNNVDQGAALIMCSTAKARSLGIGEDRWVYPWAGTDAHDTNFVSNRDNLYSSPGIRFAGARCLELADLSVSDLDHVDLYSCFPVAVQVAARELGLDATKPLTVTGGLTFAGGPLNNYVMHSIARTAEIARTEPGSRCLGTANGGYLTKHAFGIYSTDAPAQPFRHADVQAQVDAQPSRAVITNFKGQATTEAYTVMFDQAGPRLGHLCGLTAAGERVWANVTDLDQVKGMLEGNFCGTAVQIDAHLASY
jgi:acetyl-CoA C-acetyltransferase